MNRSESQPFINPVSFSLASKIILAASTDRLWPLLPGLPPMLVMNPLRRSIVSLGFGNDVAALSR